MLQGPAGLQLCSVVALEPGAEVSQVELAEQRVAGGMLVFWLGSRTVEWFGDVARA